VAFTWQINIKKQAGGGYAFDPVKLGDPRSGNVVKVGDQIFWTNDDSVPHQPGPPGYATAFVPGPIAPGMTSPAFVPDASYSGQTVTYVDALDTSGNAPTASIVISS
jgi:hypothetical protein